MESCGSVGRALDLGSKGYWFETQQSQCVKPLSKLSTGSTKEDMKSSDMIEKLLHLLTMK